MDLWPLRFVHPHRTEMRNGYAFMPCINLNMTIYLHATKDA